MVLIILNSKCRQCSLLPTVNKHHVCSFLGADRVADITGIKSSVRFLQIFERQHSVVVKCNVISQDQI